MTEATKSRYYPIYTDLRGKKVLVVGGGRVAGRKVTRLLEAGACVTLVSPRLTPELRELISQGRLNHKARRFQKEDVDDVWLVVAATDDQGVQKEVYNCAKSKRIFCNVVDQPNYCTFIVPSEVRRGDLCVAISTSGKSPALARALRIKLEHELGEEFGEYLELLGRLREFMKREEARPERRSRILKALGELKGIELYSGKQDEEFLAWCVGICGPGVAHIVRDFLKERQKQSKAD